MLRKSKATFKFTDEVESRRCPSWRRVPQASRSPPRTAGARRVEASVHHDSWLRATVNTSRRFNPILCYSAATASTRITPISVAISG